MFDTLGLLIGLFLATEAGKPLPEKIEGKVLDVFTGNRTLISFGSHAGARKGMRVVIRRQYIIDLFAPNKNFTTAVAYLEIVEVGATHCIAVHKGPVFGGPPQKGDLATYLSAEAARPPYRIPLAETPHTANAWYFRGAVIDLTLPKREP